MKNYNTETASYNESQLRQVRLRHIFFPGTYGLVGEVIVALLALVLFNVSQFSSQLLGGDLNATPLSIWFRPLQHIFSKLDHYYIAQRLTLFVVWSIVGILVYILIFRFLQILMGVRRSVSTGVALVHQDPERGFGRWLASLHNFFTKTLVTLIGVVTIASGALVCFGIASQELRNGLLGSFPGNIWPLLLSLVGALISVRVVALGLSLASQRFRNWYTT